MRLNILMARVAITCGPGDCSGSPGSREETMDVPGCRELGCASWEESSGRKP